jgi:signal transduction histidine kinase
MNAKMTIDKQQNNIESLVTSYNNQFGFHIYHNDFEKAKIYLDSSYNLVINSKENRSIIAILSNYGYYSYVVEKNFKKGLTYYKNIINEYEDEMDFNTRLNIYQNLVFGYENTNDFQMANYYLNLVIELKDQNYNDRISDAVRELETLYQIEKVESAYLSKEKELKKKQNTNQKITIILIGILIFLVILFYFFYQNLRLKQRNKIKELDFEIQQNIINASIDGQEKERKRLADILHDSISALLSSASLHIAAFIANNEIDSEDILKSKKLLKEAHDKVRVLSHELVPPLVSKFGLELAINDLCEKNSNSKIQIHCSANLQNHKRFPEDFEIKIFYILSELCNNILKHSNATEAFISIEEINEKAIKLSVVDNGVGFDTTKHSSIDGYGLTQIKARVKNLNGIMEVKTKSNQGTRINITIDIPN